MLEQVITYNVMDDGGFRDDLPFFGGTYILDRKGKEGNANKAVIDKLVEVGGLLARGKIKHSYPHSLALQGAGDLSQHAAMVRRHRPRGRRRAGHLWQDDPRTRADLNRRAGDLDAANRAQPAVLDDRGAARLGAVAASAPGACR